MDETTAPDAGTWATWLQNVATYGLQRKWDAEYLLPFTSAKQVPPTPGTPLTSQRIAGAVQIPTWAIGAGIALAGAGLWLALKD